MRWEKRRVGSETRAGEVVKAMPHGQRQYMQRSTVLSLHTCTYVHMYSTYAHPFTRAVGMFRFHADV